MGRIEADLGRAKGQADQIEEIALQLESLARNKIAGALSDLSQAWQGDNAGMFVQKGGRLEEQMVQTAADLKIAAENLRNAAERLYQAEKRAEELADRRSYGGGGMR